jgi:uncharacterized protein (TIGR00251 family)
VTAAGRGHYRWDGDTLILEVRLQPRASGDGIVGCVDGRVRIKVTAAPVDDAANERLVKLLSKEFGVAKSRIRLVSGAKSRNKRVAVSAPTRQPDWL